jgi:hypothetical protein
VTVLQLIIKESRGDGHRLLDEMCKSARQFNEIGLFFEGLCLAMTLEKGWAKKFLFDIVDIFLTEYGYDESTRNFFVGWRHI